jgi:hypothetical protein
MLRDGALLEAPSPQGLDLLAAGQVEPATASGDAFGAWRVAQVPREQLPQGVAAGKAPEPLTQGGGEGHPGIGGAGQDGAG